MISLLSPPVQTAMRVPCILKVKRLSGPTVSLCSKTALLASMSQRAKSVWVLPHCGRPFRLMIRMGCLGLVLCGYGTTLLFRRKNYANYTLRGAKGWEQRGKGV